MRRLPHASPFGVSPIDGPHHHRWRFGAVLALAAASLPLVALHDAVALPPAAGLAFRGGPLTVLDAAGPAIAKLAKGTTFSITGRDGLSNGKATAVVLDVSIPGAAKAGRLSFAARAGKLGGPAVGVSYAKGAAATQRIAVPLLPKSGVVATGGVGLASVKVSVVGWIGAAADDPTRPVVTPCRLVDSETGLGIDKGALDPSFAASLSVSDGAPAGVTNVVVLLRVMGRTGKGKLTIRGGAIAHSLAVSAHSLNQITASFPRGLDPELTIDGATADVSLDVIGYGKGSELLACVNPGGSSAPAGNTAAVLGVPGPAIGANPESGNASSGVATGANPSVLTVAPATPSSLDATGGTTTVAANNATNATNAITVTTTATTAATGATTSASAGTTTAPTVAATATTAATTATTVATTVTTVTTVATTASTTPTSVPVGRATSDRPDDVAGPQIHVVYMAGSPAGGIIDRNLDTNGALQTSLAAAQGWFKGVTGKQLRIDTYQGAPDITFVKSAYDNGDMSQFGIGTHYWIEQDLIDHGQMAAGKYYLVFYDGDVALTCGSSSHPPGIGGKVAAVYLRGPNCLGLATSSSAPGYLEFVALHEVLHMIGLVPGCAPNQISEGHVQENNDLMYIGGGTWTHTQVDVNHDDYWGHGRNNCADGARSALFTPPGPDLPPDGPRINEGTE